MSGSSFDSLPEDVLLQINQLCNRFEAACQESPGQTPRIDDWLADVDSEFRPAAIEELLPVEIAYRRQSGDACDLEELRQRFSDTDPAWLRGLLGGATVVLGSRDETPLTTVARPGDEPNGATEVPDRIGDYDLQELIGQGGMGAVYRAVHRRMGRIVALKVLRPDISRDPTLIQRFEREVRAAAKLSHPNIVTAYDAREEAGLYCLITEFIDGDDLSAMIRRDGPLPVEEAIEVILQAARGLEYAHAHGIIHRDIKPANLLCDSDGTVRILDMGLARIAADDGDAEATDLTSTGMVMGTAAYMSPEQARNTRNADARSDIYSLGCTLFFLLTGRPTYSGETVVDTIFAHASDPIPSLSDSAAQPIPAELDQVFRRMVAKQADDRFASMPEVIAALVCLQSGATASSASEAATPQASITSEPVKNDSDATTVTAPTSRNAFDDDAQPATGSTETGRTRVRNAATAAGLLLLSVIAVIAWPLLSTPETEEQRQSESTGAGDSQNGYSLLFDGRSSYVAVPTLTPDPTRPVTLEVICEVEEFRVSNMISWLGPDWMALFVTDNGHFGVGRLVGGKSRLIRSQTRAESGQTYHVAGMWDGRELSLFINGNKADVQTMGFDLPETSGGLYIGGVRPDLLPDDQNNRFFSGRIDAVRISYDVLYRDPLTVPARFDAEPNTLVLYQFDEGSGTTVSNTVSDEHVGTVTNAQWQTN